jgi:ankyrin repeat protein
MVRFLLEQKADPKAANSAGDTPLHYAAGLVK